MAYMCKHTRIYMYNVQTLTDLPVTVINHDVVRFDVPVHDTHTVTVVQCPQQFVEIIANVIVCQLLIEGLYVCVCVRVCM